MTLKDNVELDLKRIEGEIRDEKCKQIKKRGQQEHHINVWALILNEEVGELNKEILEFQVRGGGGLGGIREKLIQTITVACNILNCLNERLM